MKKEKSLLLSILLIMVSHMSSGQGLKFGGGVSYGVGGFKNMGQLQKLFDSFRRDSPGIVTYTTTNKSGTVWSVVGNLSYQFTDGFSLVSGLQYQSQKNDINIDSKTITNQNNGSYREVNSVATIHVGSFAIPALVKYSILPKKVSPFLIGGVEYEMRMFKKFSSNEKFTSYDASVPSYQHEELSFENKNIDGLPFSALNFVLGGGIDFKTGGHILSLGVYYTSTFKNSELSSTDILNGNGVPVVWNNYIFDTKQQEYLADEYKLNDWKNSSVKLNISFLF